MIADNVPSRLHASIHGYVQGVGFRFFVYRHALTLNINGWVRNRFNSTVEVMAEGCEKDLQTFLELLKEGPPGAEVVEVSEEWQEFQNEFKEFSIFASG